MNDDIKTRTLNKLAGSVKPGFQAELEPDEAAYAGAFTEDALSEQDAIESGDGLVEVDGELEPG